MRVRPYSSWPAWIKGYHRRRYAKRLQHYRPPQQHRIISAARLVAVAWLDVITALIGCILTMAMLGPAWADQAQQTPDPVELHAQAPQTRLQLPKAALGHQRTLRREAQRVWGLQAPVATFAAQVHQESRWRPDARSPVGATGLAQFMPATAQWLGGVDASLADRAPLNPTWALRALVVYDHWLHQRVRTAANPCERMAFTLAAYNGGLGWVYKRQALAPGAGMDPGTCLQAACTINPGITPASQRENERYPRAIIALEGAYLRWGPAACTS